MPPLWRTRHREAFPLLRERHALLTILSFTLPRIAPTAEEYRTLLRTSARRILAGKAEKQLPGHDPLQKEEMIAVSSVDIAPEVYPLTIRVGEPLR